MITLAGGAFAGEDVTILVPPEHLATAADHIFVVGRTTAPVVEVGLNNDIIRELVPRDSIFHTIVWFGYGVHEVTITAIWGDTLHEPCADTLELISGPKVDHRFERLYEPYAFHTETPRDECTRCHSIAMDLKQFTSDSTHCLDCHGVMRDQFRTHIPNDDRACVICHNMGADLTLTAPGTYETQNPCYSCHKDKIGRFAQDYIHGPVAGGGCVACHSPHGSPYKKSLKSPVGVLCSRCHDMHEAQEMLSKHNPFEHDQCVRCHDPHSTNHKWVLIKDSQELCLSCHEEFGTLKTHSHPYNVKPKHRLARPLQLTPRGQLECLSCHLPHASNTEHLLRTDQKNACIGCHPDQ